MIGATAPGKMMVAGEYAVLDGHPALVAATSVRVRVAFAAAKGPHARPEVDASRRLVESALGPTSGELLVDADALHLDGEKLGLGSSSAAAVATVGAVYTQHGLDAAQHRNDIFDLALRGHRAVAPEGSGADVAAAAFGGFLRCERSSDGLLVKPIERPRSMVLCVVWTGTPARTSDFVARVRELERIRPDEYRSKMSDLAAAGRELISAFECDNATRTIAAVREHHRAMAELGVASGLPIVEARLARIAELAAQCGGGAKPSGAGGGDIALAFFDAPDAASRFSATALAENLRILGIELGSTGVDSIRG